MQEGTIQAVTGQRPWSGEHGNFIDFNLTLADGQQVYISRKVKPDGSVKTPQVGESLTYEVARTDQHGTKIRQVNPQYAGNNGNSGGSSSGRDESIKRQTAAKCAAQVVAAQVASGKLSQPTEQAIMQLTDEFSKAIEARDAQPNPANNVAAQSLPPAEGIDSTAPQQAAMAGQGSPDDDIPFAPSRV